MKQPIRTALFIFIFVLLVGMRKTALYASWFQTISGDVHSNSSLDTGIPGAVSEFVSLEDLSSGLAIGDSGLLSHDDAGPNVSRGSETPELSGDVGTDWVVQSGGYPRDGSKYSYSYYDSLFTNKTNLATYPNLIEGTCSQIAPEGVYYHTGDLAITCPLTLPSGSYLFLVNGDLDIQAPIKLTNDSDFIGFIVNGTITVWSSVGGGSITDADIQGLYMTDQQFVVRPDASQLFLEGIFIAWDDAGVGQGFNLGRVGIPDEKKEVFIFRPELLFYMPREMWESSISWEEVAP